jgi:ribosomal protein L15
MRIPKLRGFKNRFKVEYEVVNVGAIEAAVERGALVAEAGGKGKAKAGTQITVNQDLLRAVGLVRSLNKPLKILGNGELSAPLFVVADAFTASARTKIEAAGGEVSVLEVPTRPLKAIGLDDAATADDDGASAPAPAPVKQGKKAARVEAAKAGNAARAAAGEAAKADKAAAKAAEAHAAAGATKAEAAAPAKPGKAAKTAKAKPAEADAPAAADDESVEATAAPAAPAEADEAAATDETTESAAADATDDEVETAPDADA